MPTLMNDLIKTLRNRKCAGKKLKDVAANLGLRASYLLRLEGGEIQCPSRKVLDHMFTEYDCTDYERFALGTAFTLYSEGRMTSNGWGTSINFDPFHPKGYTGPARFTVFRPLGEVFFLTPGQEAVLSEGLLEHWARQPAGSRYQEFVQAFREAPYRYHIATAEECFTLREARQYANLIISDFVPHGYVHRVSGPKGWEYDAQFDRFISSPRRYDTEQKRLKYIESLLPSVGKR